MYDASHLYAMSAGGTPAPVACATSSPPKDRAERPAPFDGSPGSGGVSILWIDDDVRGGDRLLLKMLGGFAVDAAKTAAEGLALALTRDYRAIVVDLRLPDISGLDVVRRLAESGATAPVLVLSGFLDVETTAAFAKLGVRHIRSKPLMGDELVEAIREVVFSETDLDRERRFDRRFPARRSHSSRDARRRLLLQTALQLTQSELPASEFVPLVVRFRRFALGRRSGGTRQGRAGRSVEHRGLDFQRLRRALAVMEQDLAVGRLSDIGSIAESAGIGIDDLRDLVDRRLGCNYRQCRRALRVRPALLAVAFTNEQYAQIAYAIGYEQPTQFTHDFSETFGIAPHAFRSLVSSAAR